MKNIMVGICFVVGLLLFICTIGAMSENNRRNESINKIKESKERLGVAKLRSKYSSNKNNIPEYIYDGNEKDCKYYRPKWRNPKNKKRLGPPYDIWDKKNIKYEKDIYKRTCDFLISQWNETYKISNIEPLGNDGCAIVRDSEKPYSFQVFVMFRCDEVYGEFGMWAWVVDTGNGLMCERFRVSRSGKYDIEEVVMLFGDWK